MREDCEEIPDGVKPEHSPAVSAGFASAAIDGIRKVFPLTDDSYLDYGLKSGYCALAVSHGRNLAVTVAFVSGS
jgi:hypothetical protein